MYELHDPLPVDQSVELAIGKKGLDSENARLRSVIASGEDFPELKTSINALLMVAMGHVIIVSNFEKERSNVAATSAAIIWARIFTTNTLRRMKTIRHHLAHEYLSRDYGFDFNISKELSEIYKKYFPSVIDLKSRLEEALDSKTAWVVQQFTPGNMMKRRGVHFNPIDITNARHVSLLDTP